MILTILLTSAALHLSLLAWMGWQISRIPLPSVSDPRTFPPLSIIIAARNEAHQLEMHLLAILEQEYPAGFEVCLVLDRCSDDSARIARHLADRFSELRWIEIDETPEGWAPKKYALHRGQMEARHAHWVFTDADCWPESNWLPSIGQQFAAGEALVIGLGPYQRKPGLLNALIQYETFYTAVQYMAWARMGQPYMAVGRNLAYTRDLFEAAGGFLHRDRLSGDDDLLMHTLPPGTRPGLNTDPEGKTWSRAKETWSAWIRQKLRHLTAGSAYRSRSLLILGIFHGLHLIFYLSLILVLCGMTGAMTAGWVYLLRTLVALLILGIPARKWRFMAPLLWFPLVDLMYFLYNLILVPISLFHQPKWKGD